MVNLILQVYCVQSIINTFYKILSKILMLQLMHSKCLIVKIIQVSLIMMILPLYCLHLILFIMSYSLEHLLH